MTDDERMDRARRIREMRDGSRPNDDEQTTDDSSGAAESDDGVPADDDSATESDETDTADVAEPDDSDGAVATDAIEESAAGAGDGEAMHIPGAEIGDVDVDVAEMARQAGLESADSVADGDADGEGVDPAAAGDQAPAGDPTAAGDPAAAGVTGAAARAEVDDAETGDETRVLEFTLGDEQYCLDIEYVEEIVKRETVTRVPNTPDCVEGVVDLRGQITTILDPKVLLDIGTRGSKDLIVVFDPEQFDDQGAVGWVVDDVDRVTPVAEDEVNSSPVDQDHVNGVVDRDGEFVIWTTPELDVEEMAG